MEYDCHTMLYIIPKKDEYEESDEFENEESDEFENDEDEDLLINNKNKSKLRIFGENFFRNNNNKNLSKNNKNESKLRILDEYFCRNNKNRGKLIINNKKSEIKDFINIENYNKEQIKIKMVLNNNLYNKSYMFKDCKSLLELTINN